MGSTFTVTIPDRVTNIGDEAFNYYNHLGNVTIPPNVLSIGSAAFYYCRSMTNLLIPKGVTYIGSSAFEFCVNLPGVYFKGNAPGADSSVFTNTHVTVYYLPGTMDWGSTFGSRPAVLWNPHVQPRGANFGIRSN